MQHDPRVSLVDMINACERAGQWMAKLSQGQFLNDNMVQYAVWAQIVIVGEAARRIPEDFRQQCPFIPWASINGMRNRLVHGYDLVDWNIVWVVATRELPQILSGLKNIEVLFDEEI